MEKQEIDVAEAKKEVITLLANAKCFIVITDNGKVTDRRMILNNGGTALAFLRDMKIMEQNILFPQSPPSTNIIKT